MTFIPFSEKEETGSLKCAFTFFRLKICIKENGFLGLRPSAGQIVNC